GDARLDQPDDVAALPAHVDEDGGRHQDRPYEGGADERAPRQRRRVLAATLTGALLATVVVVFNVRQADSVHVHHIDTYTRFANHPTTGLEKMAATGDGQAFEAVGRDPTLSDPDVFTTGRGDYAYRAQRPLLGWIGWLGTLVTGRNGVPLAMAI